MAKKKCPYCQKIIKDTATFCEHCKGEQPPLPPKKWFQGWKGLLILIFAIGILGRFLGPGQKDQTTPNLPSQTVSQGIVKSKTSDPIPEAIANCDKNAAFKVRSMLKDIANYSVEKGVVYYTWVDNWHAMTVPQKNAMIRTAADADACIERQARKILIHYKGEKVAEADPVWGIKVVK